MMKKTLFTLVFVSYEAIALTGNFGFLNKQIKKDVSEYNFTGKSMSSVFITKDGIDFYAAGLNDAHQLCLGLNVNKYSYVKLTKQNIKNIQGTGSNICIIDSSDSVLCCGKNTRGESAMGSFVNYTPANNWYTTSLTNIIELSGYNSGTSEGGFTAIKNDGSVYVWGANDTGRMLTGNTTNVNTPIMVASAGSDYVQAAMGTEAICLRKSDGSVFCAGSNANGQLGDGTTTSRDTFDQVTGLPAVVDLKAGSSHFCAKTSTGDLYCWGYNSNGQIGDGSVNPRLSPYLSATGITEFQIGRFYTMILKSGDVYFAGENLNGQFGLGNTSNINNTFVKNTRLPAGAVSSIFAASVASCVKYSGKIQCAGHNGVGTLGNGSQRQFNYFKDIIGP